MSQRTGHRALVTGGAGFIGSHAADALLDLGYDVWVVDDLSRGMRANVPGGASFEQVDVGSERAVGVIKAMAPDVIVHCAAQTSVPRSFEDPELDARSNILGTLHALTAARLTGCRRFVYVTSGGAIYGDPVHLPCGEDHPVRPLSPYGLSKWMAEEYLRLTAPREMSVVILRLANVYGPRQRSDGEGGVVAIFAERMLGGAPIEIHGDGEQTRDFVYVGDVVAAIVAASTTDKGTTVNVATGVGTSVNGLYAKLAAVTGYARSPTSAPGRRGDVRDSRLDVRRAQATLGWRPKVGLDEGLRAMVAALATPNAATPSVSRPIDLELP
jgi:UDP-glucose 4-epimerase